MDKNLIFKILTWIAIIAVVIVAFRILVWLLKMPLWLFVVIVIAGGALYLKLRK